MSGDWRLKKKISALNILYAWRAVLIKYLKVNLALAKLAAQVNKFSSKPHEQVFINVYELCRRFDTEFSIRDLSQQSTTKAKFRSFRQKWDFLLKSHGIPKGFSSDLCSRGTVMIRPVRFLYKTEPPWREMYFGGAVFKSNCGQTERYVHFVDM